MKRWLKYLQQQWEMVLVLTVMLLGTAVLSIEMERRIRVFNNKIDLIKQSDARLQRSMESGKREALPIKSNTHEGHTP